MRTIPVETAGEGGGHGDGLRGSRINAFTLAGLGQMALEQPNNLAVEHRKCLPITRSVVRLVRKAEDGRRPEAIWEIQV